MHTASATPLARERSFGTSVGGVLLVLAALQVWRGRPTYALVMGTVGFVLFVLGRLGPALLKGPSDLWWRFAAILGYINSRIILTIAFVVVFLPVSLVWRLTGRDPLGLRRERWHGWTPHPARYRATDHYLRMF